MHSRRGLLLLRQARRARRVVAVAAVAVVGIAVGVAVGVAVAVETGGGGRVQQAPRRLSRGTCHQVWGTPGR